MLRLFLSALFCLCLAPVIKADPFVITEGTTTVTRSLSFHLTLSGGGFFISTIISAAHGGVQADFSCPCFPGNLLSLSASSGPFDSTDFPGSQFFSIDGISYPISTNGVFNMTFTAGAATLPLSGDSLVTIQAPFIFSALFFTGTPGSLVIANLSGSGMAEMSFRLGVDAFGNPAYRRESLSYTFQTPEPTTILLLTTGVIILAVKLGRARRTQMPIAR